MLGMISARGIAPVARRKRAADDALLHPGLARRELAGRGEARDLGAGAGAAGRAVVGAARTQHEVAAVRAVHGRRTVELDVIDRARRPCR